MATNDDTPKGNPRQDDRNGRGRYARTLEGAERDAEAARLFSQGLNYREIGDRFGITRQAAMRAVQRAVREAVQEAGEAALRVHLDRMEWLFEKAVEVIEADHIVVSHGRIVKDDDGNPLQDHAPVLSAINSARQCLESVQTLTGMKQPTKIEHSGGVKYEVVGVDPQDLV